MRIEEALSVAKRVEYVEPEGEGEVTTAVIVKPSAYKASDYNPLTVNTGEMEEVEAIQLYLDDSWKLLNDIMLTVEDIAHEKGDWLTTYNRGRLNKIVDAVRQLRKRNINLVAGI